MKLLFICENYLPHYGGAEVVFKNLAENYVKKGHQVTLLTHQMKGTKKEEEIGGVKVIRVPSFHSRYFFTFAAIVKAIKLAGKHDLIQTTSFNGAPPAWLAGKLTGKPVVITVHEVWRKKWQEVTGFPWWKSKLHEFLEWAIYFLPYDKYICVSQATKKDLLKAGIKEKTSIKEKTGAKEKTGSEENKVETIYNGLDYHFWNEEDIRAEEVEAIRKKLGLENKFIYFSWGRPGPSKGFEYLIQAVPLIREKIPHSLCVLMLAKGTMHEKKRRELFELIKKLNLQNEIKVIEPVPHRELRYYLKAFDCAVIPSTAEGFGFNVVEANVMGIPVVASDAGSIPEVISGKYLLFRNKDIKELAEKVARVKEGKWQESPLKRFGWEESVERYLEGYSKLTKNKK